MRFAPGIASALALAVGLGFWPGEPLAARAASAIGTSSPAVPPQHHIFQASAKIVPTSRPVQCVPYARKISGIQIRGDAWAWWNKAESRYRRGQDPRVGAVLVMKKTGRLRRGHLAVVKRIVDSRTIIVDQANWLNRGRIHLNSAVRDVSAKNDWSAVRVWYTPGARYGSGTYSAHGFIYAEPPSIRAASQDSVPLPRRRPEGTGPSQAGQQGSAIADRAERRPRAPPAVAESTQPAKHPAHLPPRRDIYLRHLHDTALDESRRG